MSTHTLETRRCQRPGCTRTFRVLPTSPQLFCSRGHNPALNPTKAGFDLVRRVGRPKLDEVKLARLLSRLRELAQASTTAQDTARILHDEGFRRPKGQRITRGYIYTLRARFKIRMGNAPAIPMKPTAPAAPPVPAKPRKLPAGLSPALARMLESQAFSDAEVADLIALHSGDRESSLRP